MQKQVQILLVIFAITIGIALCSSFYFIDNKNFTTESEIETNTIESKPVVSKTIEAVKVKSNKTEAKKKPPSIAKHSPPKASIKNAPQIIEPKSKAVKNNTDFADDDPLEKLDKSPSQRKSASASVLSDIQNWRDKFIAKDKKKTSLSKFQKRTLRALINESGDVEDSEEADGVSATLTFTATFVDEKENKLNGVHIYYSTTSNIESLSDDVTTETNPLLSHPIAVSNEDGQVRFKLEIGDHQTQLRAKIDTVDQLVFDDIIDHENLWSDKIIILKGVAEDVAYISGKVSDRWGLPLPGAVIANALLESYEAHLNQKNRNYSYTVSNAQGQYSLRMAPQDTEFTISCVFSEQESKTRIISSLEKDQKITDQDFVFPQAGAEPATWSGKIISLQDTPVPDVAVSLLKHDSIESARASEQTFFTDAEGKFSIEGLEPAKQIAIYLYHERSGIVKLDQHTFEAGENYEKEYKLNLLGDEPGEIGFRLQNSDGLDIRTGWIATSPVYSDDDLRTLFQQGGSGAKITKSGVTWLKNIPAWDEIDYYYTNELIKQIELGKFKLKSGEKRNVGVIRMKTDIIEPAELSAFLFDLDDKPMEGLKITAYYAKNEKAAEGKTESDGSFYLSPLAQDRVIKIVAEDSKKNQQTIVENLVLSSFSVSGKVYAWKSRKPFDLFIKDKGESLEGIHVILTNQEKVRREVKSDKKGRAHFPDMSITDTFTLDIYHPFYHSFQEKNFSPDFDKGQQDISIDARDGIPVRMLNPDFSEGFFLRSWVGELKNGLVVPDGLPGNEYGEKIEQNEILFLTPPKDNFWIYVGSMPQPWGAKLYGPFKNGEEKILELPLEEVEPVTVKLAMDEPPDWWNLGIYAKIENTSNASQLIAKQYSDQWEGSFYLGKGIYTLKAQGRGYKLYEKDFELDGKSKTIEFQLEKIVKKPPKGGYVKTYLVSDKFKLILSEKNVHLDEQYYGFNKDWLKHLGGEASFSATHLGEYEPIEGDGVVTWRKLTHEDGVMDFKTLYPGKEGDYSVAYAQFKVVSPEAQKIYLGIGSDDGIKAWVNSKLVLMHHQPRPLYQEDHHHTLIDLKKGENQINFKVDNSWGKWQLRIRFLDFESKQPVTDLKLEPDGGFTKVEVEEEKEKA